jgi:transcriptional regulator with GAF, ATPase, and Fis domain
MATVHLIVGSHSRMLEVFDTLHNVSGSDATVLITGETGTGKELIARAIHRHSPRRDRPFVAISCPAIPETLIESELFGHVRGSFTGAVSDKKGLFEEANHGTLLLDEIAETPMAIQVKLLRALQEREIRRVGATTPVKVDVRILAATNRDLKQLVESGAFREDLYYRLNVVSINLPPLRERSTDIPQLAEYFIARACKEAGRSPMPITTEAMQLLVGYHWPGNVRQLETVLQHAILLSDGRVIDHFDLPTQIRFMSLPSREAGEAASPARADAHRFRLPVQGIDLEEVKWEFIRQAMDASGGAITEAAKLLGVTYRVLHYRLGRSSRSAGGSVASTERPDCRMRGGENFGAENSVVGRGGAAE